MLAAHELIFVQAGVLPIAEGSEEHRVGHGEWIILRAGRRHFGFEVIDGSTWFYWVCFAADGEGLTDGPTSRGRTRDPLRVRQLFEGLLDDRRHETATQRTADAYTSLLLHQLLPSRPAERPTRPQLIRAEVIAHVEAHLGDPSMTTHTIARALGYHPDYLGRVFRRSGGPTIVEHIHAQRVARARSLLERTWMPVSNVATTVGFTDPRYFRRIFSRYVGVTPVEYRAMFA